MAVQRINVRAALLAETQVQFSKSPRNLDAGLVAEVMVCFALKDGPIARLGRPHLLSVARRNYKPESLSPPSPHP